MTKYTEKATAELNSWLTLDPVTAAYWHDRARKELAIARAGGDGGSEYVRAEMRLATAIQLHLDYIRAYADAREVARMFIAGLE